MKRPERGEPQNPLYELASQEEPDHRPQVQRAGDTSQSNDRTGKALSRDTQGQRTATLQHHPCCTIEWDPLEWATSRWMAWPSTGIPEPTTRVPGADPGTCSPFEALSSRRIPYMHMQSGVALTYGRPSEAEGGLGLSTRGSCDSGYAYHVNSVLLPALARECRR